MRRRKSPDYLLKSIVISDGLHKKVNAIQYKRYQALLDGVVYDPAIEDEYATLLGEYGYASMLEAERINNASYKRVERLRDRIYTFLQMDKCKFVTLTFKPSVLDNTSIKTRRQYVSRFLKKISKYYVANIDYGSKNEREHYHAVVVTDWTDEKWKYGWFDFETIVFLDKTCTKISRYVNKLVNHAIKESTKGCRCIYSRYQNESST